MTEWNASDYHRVSTLQETLADEVIRHLRLAGSEKVLDVGCGDGKVTAQIAALLPRGSVVGVDPSQNMIDFAARNFCPDHSNLRFEVADARRLPYRGEFDLVVSFNALHWVPEQTAALRSIHAALKPSGSALLRFVPRSAKKSLEDVIEDVRKLPKWSGSFTGFRAPYVHFTPDEYRGMAAECGLAVERIDVEDKAWDFKTREAFADFCRATFVEWTRKIPESGHSDFIAEVLDSYRTVAADGPAEANVFKFQQMETVLRPKPEP